jgi:excisionase family DNA binding protein
MLTADEAAARLRISVSTLRYLRQEDRFARATKVGRRLFWDERDLDAWLEAQKEPA